MKRPAYQPMEGCRPLTKLCFCLWSGLVTMIAVHSAEPVLRFPMYAVDFPHEGTLFRRDNQWLAIREAGGRDSVSSKIDLADGVYDVTLYVVGENDGRPRYQVGLNGTTWGTFRPPLADSTTEEGDRFRRTWKGVSIKSGDTITVSAETHSEAGSDVAWGRWSKLVFTRPLGEIGPTAAQQTLQKGLSGELQKWHRVTLAFEGPDTSEQATPNPFTDYRLDVTFRHQVSGKAYRVPGYYAADGFAGETSAESGSIWRVHFLPDEVGEWNWEAAFLKGRNVAMYQDYLFSHPVLFDGQKGRFTVAKSDKSGRDFRSKGRLSYTGERYLRFSETGEAFLKGGADSPENFLAYVEFDGTNPIHKNLGEERSGEAAEAPLHKYEPHRKDWSEGDPSWKGGQGKNIIGVLNYLASQEMNSVYFLTMNVTGDGDDVWPWTSREERFRFDCSKLDQWEVVFSHMDRLGLMLHVVTQETENDQLLDSGALGLQRKLYYRELIARFGHHPSLVWNFGEENTNTDRERSMFADFFQALDPYDHPVVVHTYPGQYNAVYTPLLGHAHFEGPSLQMGNMKESHSETIKWIRNSAAARKQWVVCLDEIGPADTGVKPDADDFWHDDVRRYALWGNLMGGGAGVEWYFGYRYAHNDLNCEDLRSRENMWHLTRVALQFFHAYLPFAEMESRDELTRDTEDYVFAKPNEVYCVYSPDGKSIQLDLSGAQGSYSVAWFNPRTGRDLMAGPVTQARGGQFANLGNAPAEVGKDWVALVRRVRD